MKTTKVFEYNVFSAGIDSIKLTDSILVINTINAYSYIVAKSDPTFSEALKASDILLPDGFPVVTAAKWLAHEKIVKIAGADIFYHLCGYLNGIKGRCFFLGSSDSTLALIEARLKKDFPNITAGYYSPPYKKIFSAEDNQKMIEAVNAFEPNVVFVGMTAPKQEKWVHEHSKKLKTGIICSIGAVFDFYAGSVKRPAPFWIRMKLEWFIRLLKEPRRLWKRYLVYSPLFFVDLILWKVGVRRRKTED
jgi:N-acetylglucosaminyldiphosphoundecaprenol N-acetyl-beta-D-mannosaminyltransferase